MCTIQDELNDVQPSGCTIPNRTTSANAHPWADCYAVPRSAAHSLRRRTSSSSDQPLTEFLHQKVFFHETTQMAHGHHLGIHAAIWHP